jgi:hypothetical protein
MYVGSNNSRHGEKKVVLPDDVKQTNHLHYCLTRLKVQRAHHALGLRLGVTAVSLVYLEGRGLF